MNPPTTGHKLLIQSMIEHAIANGQSRVYIILTGTKDNQRNPLDCNYKRYLVQQMVDQIKLELGIDIEVIIICSTDKPIQDMFGNSSVISATNYLHSLHKPTKGNMIMFLGNDRRGDFDWLQSEKFKISFVYLGRPEGAMSATKVRGLALSETPDDRVKYQSIMSDTGISPVDIANIQREIVAARERVLSESAKKSSMSAKKKKQPTAKHKGAERKPTNIRGGGRKTKRNKQRNKRSRKNKCLTRR